MTWASARTVKRNVMAHTRRGHELQRAAGAPEPSARDRDVVILVSDNQFWVLAARSGAMQTMRE